MLVSDRIRLSDMSSDLALVANDPSLSPSVREVLMRIVMRFNQFAQDMVMQLNSRPLIFNVDPAVYPDKVKGARPGDISVFTNSSGDVEIVLFR